MILSKLLLRIPEYKIFGKKDSEVKDITEDSRKVKKGSLFVAIKGLTVDGHEFISSAIRAGATVVVGEKSVAEVDIDTDKVTYIEVKNSRRALGLIASGFYDNPSGKLKVIGVTGTDGKTTTASLIYHILTKCGKKAGLVSTVSAVIGKKEVDTGFHVTSPDPVSLQRFLANMVKINCEYAVLEVTSHGLEQDRFSGVDVEIGVLTNITHEHLDYHKTFQNYLFAKCKLFENVKVAVLNLDDKNFESFNCVVPYGSKVFSYAINNAETDINAISVIDNVKSTEFEILIFDEKAEPKKQLIKTSLLGNYNVSNILAAIGVTSSLGIQMSKIASAIQSFRAPTGRLEVIPNNKGFYIYIDFAHTPNALENVLTILKQHIREKQRLIVVFGCAGERDLGKRSMMGEIAARIADISIFTAEDPRSEDINKIISQMVEGAKKNAIERKYSIDSGPQSVIHQQSEKPIISTDHVFVRIPERGEAISYAIQRLARKGDTVVMCGKGHEKSMAYKGIEYPWSDQEATHVALEGKMMDIHHL